MATTHPVAHEKQQPPHGLRVQKRSRRRACLCCCGICSTIVVVVVVLLVILIFTVFKQKDPRIHVDSVTLQGLSVNLGNILTDPSISVDLGLLTEVSVKNPNYAGFKYKNTTAYIYYQGIQIGDVAVPPGEVKARRTAQFTTGAKVHISSSIVNTQLSNDVAAGVLPIVTTIQIKGTAKVFNVFKINNVRTNANCSVNVFLVNQTQNFFCNYRVKF